MADTPPVIPAAVAAPVAPAAVQPVKADPAVAPVAPVAVQPVKADPPVSPVAPVAEEELTSLLAKQEEPVAKAPEAELSPEAKAKAEEDAKVAADKQAAESFDASKLKLPEGIKADDKTLSKVSEIAKKYNLSQAAVQELAETHAATLLESAKQMQTASQNQFKNMIRAGQSEIAKDPVLGGPKLKETLAIAQSAYEKITSSPALQPYKAALDQMYLGKGKDGKATGGVGDLPANLALFHYLGVSGLIEDRPILGNTNSGPQKQKLEWNSANIQKILVGNNK